MLHGLIARSLGIRVNRQQRDASHHRAPAAILSVPTAPHVVPRVWRSGDVVMAALACGRVRPGAEKASCLAIDWYRRTHSTETTTGCGCYCPSARRSYSTASAPVATRGRGTYRRSRQRRALPSKRQTSLRLTDWRRGCNSCGQRSRSWSTVAPDGAPTGWKPLRCQREGFLCPWARPRLRASPYVPFVPGRRRTPARLVRGPPVLRVFGLDL